MAHTYVCTYIGGSERIPDSIQGKYAVRIHSYVTGFVNICQLRMYKYIPKYLIIIQSIISHEGAEPAYLQYTVNL